ncbi:GntR family transcriptional regulator [Spirillospora sp. NPDC047279]|uniref:GntR family transcriptional regulator n=1 Tax=Spirillospora sp. NPDC047279 TaxID=3155478 RepID=UPI003401823C
MDNARMSPQQVCKAIRDDIIRRVFEPGRRLTEESLAARYGVSRVPVREALRTLEAEGFVHSRKYVGTFVAELSETEAADLLEIRGLLEPLCASRAAARRTPEQLGRLKELVALGLDAVADGRLEELARLNSRFHEVLAEASGSTLLSQLIDQLSQKIAWVYSVELPRRAHDSWQEHVEICAALEAGDPERAHAAVTRHISHAEAAYLFRDRGTGSAAGGDADTDTDTGTGAGTGAGTEAGTDAGTGAVTEAP